MRTKYRIQLAFPHSLWPGVLVCLVVLSAACSGVAPATPTTVPTTVPIPPTPRPTATQVPAAPSSSTGEPEVTIVMPDELPMKGVKWAKVTIIEFSDFQ